ncbi:MAG: translocation/assembly module TamB domain-containing protein [Gemmatimonadaceae bacterium]
MSRAGEILRGFFHGLLLLVTIALVLVAIAATATFVLTGTEWGRERVRGIAQNGLTSAVHGKVSIGKLSGNLLTGLTAHDVVITDSSGGPFVSIESLSANYSIAALARKQIYINDAVIVHPRIVLDHPVGGVWNWQRLFPHDTIPKLTKQPGWLDRVRLTNTRIVDGQIIVKSPWMPNAKLSAKARDSVLRETLAGRARLRVEQAPGGYQKIVELDSLTAQLPLLRLAEPGEPVRIAEVASLRMNVFPFHPPALAIRDLKGVFSFNSDSIWWKGAYAELPASKATADGSYLYTSGDVTLALHSDQLAFSDMGWLDPKLPGDGTGAGDLKVTWRGTVQDYTATNTTASLGSARASGAIGITMGDTIAIHDTRMRVSGLDTRTIQRLVPTLKSPRSGMLSGLMVVRGGIHAMQLNGDVTFDDHLAGVSRITGSGEVGLIEGGGLQARNLQVQMLPVQVAMAKTWYPSLPVGGVVTGNATINGSTKTSLMVKANLDHRDRGTRSVLDGTATVRLAGLKRFNVDMNAKPVSLEEIGRFFPAAGLQGSAAGPVRLEGALDNLKVNVDLVLPDGGKFATTGTLDLASTDKAYDLAANLYTLNLRTIDTKAPVTSLTAKATIKGRGITPETMTATATADLSASRYTGTGPLDSIALDTVSLRASLAGGLATVQKLYAVGAHTSANVSGSFGISHEARGTLTYAVATDSLGAFNRLFPLTDTSHAPVQPRPGIFAHAVDKARADSLRVARATEMERLISGKPGPALAVNAPKPVPSDTLSGSVSAKGTLVGNIYDFDLRGTANGKNVIARGNAAKTLAATYAWTGVRTPKAELSASADLDTASIMGFAFDTVSAKATYTPAGGHVELSIGQGENRQYAAKGDYALFPDRKELNLANLAFRFDTATWTMTRPSKIQWGDPGLRVTDFELRNRGNGRIYANGLLPTKGTADFALTIENFPVTNIVDITQTDLKVTGVANLKATATGTMAAPSFRGTFGLTDATYNGVTVPSLSGRLGYSDRALVAHMDALRSNGVAMATVDGRIPINLALSGVTGSRMLPDPLQVDLVADSLPLELISQFTSSVTDLHGRAAGKFSVRGTTSKPVLAGNFAYDHGSFTVVASGAKLVDVAGAIHMASDTVYVDSLIAHTVNGRNTGTVSAKGTLGVADFRQPAMDFAFVSNGAQLMNNKDANLRIDAKLALKGPFNGASLKGNVTLVQGVIYAPEPSQIHHLIGASDPALYNVLDTAVVSERDLFPPQSPLLANLSVEVSLDVKHDTWVRNREANVEIYTETPVTIRQEGQALLLTGVVATDRGEYSFLSKRFQIKRGSALFIGTPDLDPTLQITGEYQVNVAARGAVNIRVIVGGTLRRPKLSLESDAQPPKTQSELLSLLAFGQSSSSLIASNSSSLAGSTAGDLFGVGAQAAVQRLAGVALGVAVQQVEMQAGRTLGTDVFDITPGDVPLFGGNGASSFFAATQVQAGKYVTPRTFVSASEQAGRPGLSIEQRTPGGWRLNLSMEPRILLGEPTLSLQPRRTTQSYGGFVIREWRF